MAIHAKLDVVIRSLNPIKVKPNQPEIMFNQFTEFFRNLLAGFGKILELCNIFLVEKLTRFQRHEIIKFSRSRMPIFLTQIHQLVMNINDILGGLNSGEKALLVAYLVPQIEKSLLWVKKIVVQVKVALKKVYDTMKRSKDSKDILNVESNKHFRTEEVNNLETESEIAFSAGNLYEVRKIRDIYDRVRSVDDMIEQNRYELFNVCFFCDSA